MKSPEDLISDLNYSDPTTHCFVDCIDVLKPLGGNLVGIYKQRLDACDLKLRFAAKSLLEIRRIVSELEHGEFIYFDDANRLSMSFYVESFVIFLRSTLDLEISAYYLYFSSKSDIDSFNDFIKLVGKDQRGDVAMSWLPVNSKNFWFEVHKDYDSVDPYTWIHALVGTGKGQSLRDLVIHKQSVFVDTYIDADDKGRFYIGLKKYVEKPLVPWLLLIFQQVQTIMDKIKDDIMTAERVFR